MIFSDRTGDPFVVLAAQAAHADALLAAGEWRRASEFFAKAELLQQGHRPLYPLLYSQRGYRYCDLLLSRSRAADARDRAAQTIEVARRMSWVHSIALDALTLGRAQLGLALQCIVSDDLATSARDYARAAGLKLDEALEGLRASGQFVWVPRGLLARAAFRRSIADFDGAASDLEEAEEIAAPGPMQLSLCDCALERARVALALREAFAPLDGLIGSSSRPAVPPPTHAASLVAEARKALDTSRKLVAECGYHRRDVELDDLDDVVTGRRCFAELPACV